MTVNGACCAIESCPCCPGCGCGGRRFTLSQPPFFSQPFFKVILYKSCGELSISVQYMPDIKFVFSKKATKIDEIFTVHLTLTT